MVTSLLPSSIGVVLRSPLPLYLQVPERASGHFPCISKCSWGRSMSLFPLFLSVG